MSEIYADSIQAKVNGIAQAVPLRDSDAQEKIGSLSEEINTSLSYQGISFVSGYVSSTGSMIEDTVFFRSNYIPVYENISITYVACTNNEFVNAISCFDENKNYISGFSNQGTDSHVEYTETLPNGTRYIILSIAKSQQANWKLTFSENCIDLILKELCRRLLFSKTDKQLGKNLFNSKSKNIRFGKYLLGNGRLGTNQMYFVSDYIPVDVGMYSFNAQDWGLGGAYYCIYDKYMNVISSGKATPISISQQGYVRMSGLISRMDTQQFEKGETSTDYEPYTDYFPSYENKKEIEKLNEEIENLDEQKNNLRVVLPQIIYTVTNKALPLYFENIMFKSKAQSGDVYIDKGTKTSRLQNVILNTAGEQTANVMVIDKLNKQETKSLKIITRDIGENSAKTVNLLTIGDSFTDIGSYIVELKRLLEADGTTVNLIGTCGSSQFKAEGLSGGILANTFLNSSAGVGRIVDVTGVTQAPNTGYPGRTYRDGANNEWTIRGSKIGSDGSGKMVVTKYQAEESDFDTFPSNGVLTKVSSGGEGDNSITYSNPRKCYYNPFINPSNGTLDIQNYLREWEFENPDIIIFQFTYNDIPVWASDENLQSVTDNFITAVVHIHKNIPDAKIIISIEPYGALNTKTDWNGKKYSVLKWVEMLCNTFETVDYEDYVFIAPSYACVDLEYGYSDSDIVPCDRYPNIVEKSSGDGVHPKTGMLQISDCLYPIVTYINSLSQ